MELLYCVVYKVYNFHNLANINAIMSIEIIILSLMIER